MTHDFTSQSRDATSAIHRRISLTVMREIVGQYVKLNKSNRGPCPFHGGRDANLSLFHRGTAGYHCFVCGASGDAFRFLMDMTGAEFPAVRKELAARVGVELPVFAPTRRTGAVKGIGPLLQALAGHYLSAPLPPNAPAWVLHGAARGMVGVGTPQPDFAEQMQAWSGLSLEDLQGRGVCSAAGADEREGTYVVVLKDRDGQVTTVVGTDADGRPVVDTAITQFPEATMAGWMAARNEAGRLGWVILAPTLAAFVHLAAPAQAVRVPVVASLRPAPERWNDPLDRTLLQQAGVHSVLLQDWSDADPCSQLDARWAFATAEGLLRHGVCTRFAVQPLPALPSEGPGMLKRLVEQWGATAEDAFGRRVALVKQTQGYVRRAGAARAAFAIDKVLPALHATSQCPDRLLHEAFMLWVTKELAMTDAQVCQALAAYEWALNAVPLESPVAGATV